MDNEQARVLLSCCRENGQDSNDPMFKDALNLSSQDDQLKAWFEEDKKLDREMKRATNKIPVPDDLRCSILASQFMCSEKEKKSNLLNFSLLAIAAALAITLFTLSMVTNKSGVPTDQQWAEQITNRVQGDFHLKYRNGNFERIEGWLNANNSPLVSNQLARNLSATQPVGCCVMERFGQKVSLMCFLTDSNEWIHLFVMDKNSVQDSKNAGMSYLSHDNMKIAKWTDQKNAYFLASESNTPEFATKFF